MTPAPPPPRTTTFLAGVGVDMEGGEDDVGAGTLRVGVYIYWVQSTVL